MISLVNELSRLASNSVTLGNYQFPLKISSFVSELFAGYQLVSLNTRLDSPASLLTSLSRCLQLNLRNDSLRRRFDSLKYDLKAVESVVYDISLRGLVAQPAQDASMST